MGMYQWAFINWFLNLCDLILVLFLAILFRPSFVCFNFHLFI